MQRAAVPTLVCPLPPPIQESSSYPPPCGDRWFGRSQTGGVPVAVGPAGSDMWRRKWWEDFPMLGSPLKGTPSIEMNKGGCLVGMLSFFAHNISAFGIFLGFGIY